MIKPDYALVKDLFLAYPLGFGKHYNSFIPFFDELISLIPNEVHLYIIVNNERAARKLHSLFPDKNLDVTVIKEFYEIWLRDIMGFNRNDCIIKPIFKPDYYKDVYTDSYLKKIDRQVREIISNTIQKEVIDLPLIWDGGNLVTNGKVGFITDKILRDNRLYSQDKIEAIIKEYTGLEPIIIPTSEYDKLGHSDGFVSFLNENTVCLASYPFEDAQLSDSIYVERLEKVLNEKCFRVVRSIEAIVNEKSRNDKDFIYSAKGCYVNNIILNNTLILPQYTLTSTQECILYNHANYSLLKKYFVKVAPINCDAISADGGVLRCLSFIN